MRFGGRRGVAFPGPNGAPVVLGGASGSGEWSSTLSFCVSYTIFMGLLMGLVGLWAWSMEGSCEAPVTHEPPKVQR